MYRFIKLLVLSAVISVVFGQSLQAHPIDYGLMKNEIGLDAGRVDGSGDFEDIIDGGGVVGAHYTRFLTPRFGLGIQVDHMDETTGPTFTWESFSIPGFGSVTTYTDIEEKFVDTSVLVTGRMNIWTRGIVVPYLMTGIGANRFAYEVTARTQVFSSVVGIPSSSSSESESESSFGFSGTIGAGLDIMLSEVCRVGGEARYTYHQQDAVEDIDALETTMVKGRISWYF